MIWKSTEPAAHDSWITVWCPIKSIQLVEEQRENYPAGKKYFLKNLSWVLVSQSLSEGTGVENQNQRAAQRHSDLEYMFMCTTGDIPVAASATLLKYRKP